MDKKYMNKMENMEMDKVSGGKRYVYPTEERRPNRPIKEWHIERKQVINRKKTVKRGHIIRCALFSLQLKE